MNRFDRITVSPAIVSGQPCIRGMRLTVKRVVEAVALYPNRDELQREYPELEAEDIRQALDFAACNLDDRMIHLEAALSKCCWIGVCRVLRRACCVNADGTYCTSASAACLGKKTPPSLPWRRRSGAW